jgi:hypothetical protein
MGCRPIEEVTTSRCETENVHSAGAGPPHGCSGNGSRTGSNVAALLAGSPREEEILEDGKRIVGDVSLRKRERAEPGFSVHLERLSGIARWPTLGSHKLAF